MNPYTQQYEFNKVKKQRQKRLIITYIIMTFAIIVISALCIALVLGWRFSGGQVKQGALVQFASFPSSATVTLDGTILNLKTPGKRDVDAGSHDVTISKEDYRNWNKQLSLEPGEVRWINYARLIPKDVDTKVLKEYPNLSQILPSIDRDYIMVVPDATKPELEIIDIRDLKQITYTQFAIPSASLSLPPEIATHSYRLIEWSLDSKYILVEHKYGDSIEFIRIDCKNFANAVNLTVKFGVPIADVHFSTGDVFYGIDSGNMRRYDMNAEALSEPLARNVTKMKLFGDTDIALLRQENARFIVETYIDGKITKIVDYDETRPILMDIASYYNNRYLSISRGNELVVYENPHRLEKGQEPQQYTKQIFEGGEIKWLDMSSVGRFVIAGQSRQWITYDIELDTKSDINLAGMPGYESVPPQWIDESNIISIADNKLRMVDFNGDNEQVILNTLLNFPVSLNDNGKVLFSTNRNQAGVYQLQVSNMTIEKLTTTLGISAPVN
ncbi:PEGA domain-containing protein [Candidatus Saccharibacteria bacterium]|nr:PEGA domain-containing protein [Candidatus Saccharibacteria bacterium]